MDERKDDPFQLKASGNQFLDLIGKEMEFFVRYLSIYFPFTEKECLEYWDVLEPGNGHYTVFHSSTQAICTSQLGLCYNQNIRWTQELKSKFTIGYDDPYEGYYIGLGETSIEYDDKENLYNCLPLNLQQEWWYREFSIMNYHQRMGSLEEYLENNQLREGLEEEMILKEIPKLSFDKFLLLYKENPTVILFNRSLWFNTLYYEIKEGQVFRLLRLRRLHKHDAVK